jgi:hypothetical protein
MEVSFYLAPMMNETQTPNTMQNKSTKGRDLAYEIATRLRGNEFKDMTLGEIDDFRAEMALFLDLKKEW